MSNVDTSPNVTCDFCCASAPHGAEEIGLLGRAAC